MPSFDQEVLTPLRATQAAAAEQERLAAEAAARQAEAQRQAYLNSVAARVQPYGNNGNNYAWGNCTRYVASRVRVPDSMGDARNWGYILGAKPTPVVGAIAWTTAGWAGHVAVVEQVVGFQVYVSEENVYGLGVVDYRWTTVSDWSGFIY